MWKLMTGMRRKAGISAEQFRDYYESVHAPLAAAVLAGIARDYRRNYVVDRRFVFPDRPEPSDPLAAPAFDCIAEIWFDSREDIDRLLRKMVEPQVQGDLVSDRARFIDESSICYMICEER